MSDIRCGVKQYVNEFGGRYKVMRERTGEQYQVWHCPRGGDVWLPYSRPKGSREEAQTWLDELAGLYGFRIFRGVV